MSDPVELTGMKFGKIYRTTEHDAGSLGAVTYEYFKLLAHENLQRFEIKYPENWKESIKERFLPEYLKRYFPVKYKVVVISADVVYPEIHNKIKLKEPHVLVLSQRYDE